MKYLLSLIFLLCCCFVAAGGTKSVEQKVDCIIKASEGGKLQAVKLGAYVDDNGDFYISTARERAGLPLRGYVEKAKYKEFIAALEKGKEWAKKVQEHKLAANKKIATFASSGKIDDCGVIISFFSAENGEDACLFLTIVDFENQFSKGVVILPASKIDEFLAVIKELPNALKALKAEIKKADDILQ